MKEVKKLGDIKLGKAITFNYCEVEVINIFPKGNNITDEKEPYYIKYLDGEGLSYFSRDNFLASNIPKTVFIICTVRNATFDYQNKLEKYVKGLEFMGYKVHLPHRDTNQKGTSLEICTQNLEAIKKSNEIHIFYNPESQGTHFDMGISFALNKKIVIVESVPLTEGKSYQNLLKEYEGEFN